MVLRQYPQEYFDEQGIAQYPRFQEPVIIPIWVPILLGIALVGAFAVAIYALSRKR